MAQHRLGLISWRDQDWIQFSPDCFWQDKVQLELTHKSIKVKPSPVCKKGSPGRTRLKSTEEKVSPCRTGLFLMMENWSNNRPLGDAVSDLWPVGFSSVRWGIGRGSGLPCEAWISKCLKNENVLFQNICWMEMCHFQNEHTLSYVCIFLFSLSMMLPG